MNVQEEVAAAVKATQGSAETGKSTQTVTEELDRAPAIEHAPVMGNSSQAVTAEFLNRAPEIEKVTGGKFLSYLSHNHHPSQVKESLISFIFESGSKSADCALLSVCYGKHPCSLNTWIELHEVTCTQIILAASYTFGWYAVSACRMA